MSMLSSKCDGLRNAADELQNVIDNAHNYTWPGIVSTLHYAVHGLRDAADTIWELRNKLAGVVDQQDEIERIQSENAKLRESVRNLLICAKHEECEVSCPHYEPMYTDYGYEKTGSTVVESEYLGCCTVGLENCNSMFFDTDEYLRELGIEAI